MFKIHRGLRGWYFRVGRLVIYAGMTFTKDERR